MHKIPVPTRITKDAEALLKKKASRARVGYTTYASQLLESALLGEGGQGEGGARTSVVPPELFERLLAELLFTGEALERFLEKQPGLVERLRKDAELKARAILAGEEVQVVRSLESTASDVEVMKPSETGPGRKALVDRLTGS